MKNDNCSEKAESLADEAVWIEIRRLKPAKKTQRVSKTGHLIL